MKILIALFVSTLFITSRATSGLYVSAGSDTANFPATLGASTSVTASTALSSITASSTNTFAFKVGLPTTSLFILENDGVASTNAAKGFIIQLSVGPQVSLQISAATSTGQNTIASAAYTGPTITAGSGATSVASAAAVTSTVCGQYYLDCTSGLLTFSLYTTDPGNTAGSTNNNYCSVQITQVNAITGILQYPTASVPTQATVIAAITASNSATSPVTTICGTGTSNTNTLYYFISTYGTSTATADQTAAFTKVKGSASTGGLASNTAYYVQQQTMQSALGVTAPSSSASSNLASISKSQSRMVVFAGVFTTAVATLFGFAL